MKSIITVALALIMLLSTACFASAETSVPTSTALNLGSVDVYDFSGIRLHAYNTADPLADVSYAFETDASIVLLESSAFSANITAWNDYLKTLGKPIAGKLMAYHPNGADQYGESAIYATENAQINWLEGGSIRGLVDSFVPIFGDALDSSMPTATNTVQAGDQVTIGGIDFVIIASGDDAFGVEIPQINCVYRHMMGSTSHNILANVAHIDATIAELTGYQEKGYELVLTSHNMPEGQAAIATKIAYLEKTKALAQSSDSKEHFVAAMNEAYPDYAGANYLDMTAGFLFP